MGGSYSDIKTNLSQVGLDWDWPTGLILIGDILLRVKQNLVNILLICSVIKIVPM